MKNPVISAILIACCLFSCKKDIVSTPVTQVETEVQDSSSLESKTALYPLQKSVFTRINGYIGGYVKRSIFLL